jgi:DNA repair exonuclease SbcCD ATPase subunit
MENMQETVEAVAETAPEASTHILHDGDAATAGYTADDLARVREQEKAKLYPQLEKMKEELATLKRLREEQEAKDAERQARLEAEAREKAEREKELEESELSFKDLLKKKEEEFNSQLENERLERERAFALLEQERKFQELMQYRQQRLEQERDNIIPELIDLIDGNTPDEVEQSIAGLKDKSARIIDSAQQAMSSARQQMAGARITAPAAGPLDNDMDQRSYTPDSIRDMSLADYAKQRAKLLGNAASNRGQGLFG